MIKQNISRAVKRVSALASASALSILLSAPAQADLIFDWTGTCVTACNHTVSAVLTLADTYTGGRTTNPADFISFVLSPEVVPVIAMDLTGPNDQFVFDASTSEFAFTKIFDTPVPASRTMSFSSDQNGIWEFQDQSIGTSLVRNAGINGVFTLRTNPNSVPAPAPLALLSLGLVGLALRKRKAA